MTAREAQGLIDAWPFVGASLEAPFVKLARTIHDQSEGILTNDPPRALEWPPRGA